MTEHAFGPYGIDHALAEARRELDRVTPRQAYAVQADGGLVVDIRPESDRRAEGTIPGAVVVERIHLEWRLDPAGPDRLDDVRPERAAVIVCNEGYASSLAAAQVRALGLTRATDMEGGFRAWKSAGLPVAADPTA